MFRRPRLAVSLTVLSALLSLAATMVLFTDPASAEAMAATAAAPSGSSGDAVGMGYLAAALATGLSSLGAGFAVGHLGSAAVGAVTEKPELFGRLLILVGLAEGIAIYGLIVSILILNRLT